MKKVLIIAFHFPPFPFGSGYQRIANYCKYLPQNGWEPIVLTVNPMAFCLDKNTIPSPVPDGVQIYRSFALDAAHHLAIAGKYPSWFALPDRWVSWWPFARMTGKKLIDHHKPDILLSTYPIATAHLIGASLATRHKIPWLAEFRDPMTDPQQNPDELGTKALCAIEERTLAKANACLFTTNKTRQYYEDRYRTTTHGPMYVIENGYDETMFSTAEHSLKESPQGKPRSGQPLVILHSGVLYREGRDLSCFMQALSQLKAEGTIARDTVQIVLRASGDLEYQRKTISENNLEDIVILKPGLPHKEAIGEMLLVDALLLVQGGLFELQIPAKAYEYMRSRKPVFTLTNSGSETENVMRKAGLNDITDIGSVIEIRDSFAQFIRGVRDGATQPVPDNVIASVSRQARVKELSFELNNLLDTPI